MKILLKNNGKATRILRLLIIAFILIFVLRWGYEIYFSNNDIIVRYESGANNIAYSPEPYEKKTSNVASAKISQKDISGQAITIDQKYEKTANLSSQTANFQNDNRKLRQAITDNDAVIQTENLTGLEGSQSLTMTIGVMPDRFDVLVQSIKEIGEIKSFTVNKSDKTAEFNSLIAEQETLKKTRDSYVAIKEKGGNIQDLLLLEDKILEVEKNLQNLGVDIGIYANENSFCTVNFSLYESEVSTQQISIRFVLTCAKNSFFWTVMSFVFVGFLIFMALTAVIFFLWLLSFVKKMVGENNKTKTDDEENEAKETK